MEHPVIWISIIQAGIPFNIGDILQIISKDDHNWWQVNQLNKDYDRLCRYIGLFHFIERYTFLLAVLKYFSYLHSEGQLINARLNYVTYLNSLGKEYGTPCMYIRPT